MLNPKSQSFSRSYGSNLPTSLTYIVPITRGCSPWRPAAVMSTDGQENDSFPSIFKGCRRRTGHLRKRDALPTVSPLLRLTRFQGHRNLERNGSNARSSAFFCSSALPPVKAKNEKTKKRRLDRVFPSEISPLERERTKRTDPREKTDPPHSPHIKRRNPMPFRCCTVVKKKRELFPGPSPTSRGSFALPQKTYPCVPVREF